MNDSGYKDLFKEKVDLTVDQLIVLYQHMTHDIRVRDNLFIPLSIAILPATILAWKNIDFLALSIIGVISIILYVFNMLFIFRFTAYQDEVIRMLNRRSNFAELVQVQKDHYFGDKLLEKKIQIRVRTLRIYLFFFIVFMWVALGVVKFYSNPVTEQKEPTPKYYLIKNDGKADS
jgi:uncharacterized protein YacL